jgi:hypothetical protein
MLFRRVNLLPVALTPKRDTSNAQNELKKEVDIGMSDK